MYLKIFLKRPANAYMPKVCYARYLNQGKSNLDYNHTITKSK